MTTSRPLRKTSRFLSIPPEIRLIIYENHHTPVPWADLAHRESSPCIGFQLHKFTTRPNVWVLLACKQIHQQAKPIFYGSYRFHFSILKWPRLPISPLMRHISVDFATLLGWQNIDIYSNVQGHNVNRIQDIYTTCLNLKTFSLHLLANSSHEEMPAQFFPDVPTSRALSVMRYRGVKISIATSGTKQVIRKFLLSIAPCEQWLRPTTWNWPDVTLAESQKAGLKERWEEDWEHRIRIWGLKEQGFGKGRKDKGK